MHWSRDLFDDAVKPTIEAWLKELVEMTRGLRGRRLTDVAFQGRMEDLYRRADLPALVGLVEFDEIEKRSKLPGTRGDRCGPYTDLADERIISE